MLWDPSTIQTNVWSTEAMQEDTIHRDRLLLGTTFRVLVWSSLPNYWICTFPDSFSSAFGTRRVKTPSASLPVILEQSTGRGSQIVRLNCFVQPRVAWACQREETKLMLILIPPSWGSSAHSAPIPWAPGWLVGPRQYLALTSDASSTLTFCNPLIRWQHGR